MKQFILILTLLVGVGLSCVAQEEINEKTVTYQNEEGETIETTKPIFQFDKETHDFGEISEGPKYDYEFEFTNIGKEPLIITNVKASCGCTTPDWSKEPIMPGETSTIKVIYNTKGRLNNFNKAITITSNAITPTKRLFIKGKVLPAEPQMPVKTEKSLIENVDEDN